MKTTGVRDIPKFGLLFFLGHPTVYVFLGSTSSRCGNEYTWPDLDDGVVCGDCIVLVRHMDTYYRTCSNYCNYIGRGCLAAWEEAIENSCIVKSIENCFHDFGSYTSDAICECAN